MNLLLDILLAVLAIFILVAIFGRRGAPSTPPPRYVPGGPETLGSFALQPLSMPVTPAQPGVDTLTGDGPWTVTVTAIGDDKIYAIKTVRATVLGMTLKPAKDFVESVPGVLFVKLSTTDAKRVRAYLEAGGLSLAIGPSE